MIDVETRARIRRLFYVEHWKIGTIARELGFHPETVSLAVETDRFNNTKTLRSSVTDPYADFIREILAKHPRLRATRIFQMIRDRGYSGSIVQLRRFVACIRPAHREAFLRLQHFSWRTRTSGLGAFWRSLRWSCAPPAFLFCNHAFLFPGPVSGVLFRSEAWKAFYAVTFMPLRTGKVSQESCSTTIFAVLCLSGAGMPSIFIPGSWNYAPIITLQPVLARFAPAIRRGELNESSGIYENPSLPPVHLPRWKISTDRLLNGETAKRIAVHGLATITARWKRFLRKKGLVCCRCPHIDSIPIFWSHCNQAKPFMCALISMTTRFLRMPSTNARISCLPLQTSTIRILDGSTEIARHRRSYDRGQPVLDPAHQEELLQEKRKASGSTRGSRLSQAVPESEALLDAAFVRGESASRQTTELLNLLDLYGARELRAAVCEALERKTPRASSVDFILNQRRRSNKRRAPVPVDLSRHPELENLSVTPHDLETYDDLAKDDSTE